VDPPLYGEFVEDKLAEAVIWRQARSCPFRFSCSLLFR